MQTRTMLPEESIVVTMLQGEREREIRDNADKNNATEREHI